MQKCVTLSRLISLTKSAATIKFTAHRNSELSRDRGIHSRCSGKGFWSMTFLGYIGCSFRIEI